MKRIAIPVTAGKLSEFFFGFRDHFEIFDVEQGIIQKSEIKTADRSDISDLPQWAQDNQITDIITHKLDAAIIDLFTAKKINLYVGIAIDTPQILIDDYLSGKLRSDEQIIKEIKSDQKK